MFNKNLGGLTLATGAADACFPNTSGSSFCGDTSFLATIRALLLKRNRSATVRFRITNSRHRAHDIQMASHQAVFGAILNTREDETILLHDLIGSEEDAQAVMDKFDDERQGFVRSHNNFCEMKDLREFVSRVMNARFYINENRHMTIILVSHLDLRKYHYLQSILPRYMPWVFADNPVDDEERSLLHALTEKYAPTFERMLDVFTHKIDFRAMAVQTVLGGFEKRAKQGRVNSLHDTLERINSMIADNVNSYTRLITDLESTSLQLAGLEAQMREDKQESELIEYFTCNRQLTPLDTYGTSFSFIVNTYLESFDPDMYQVMAGKPTSHLFRGYDVGGDFADEAIRKKFLDAIFSDEPLLRIKVCAFYQINTVGSVESSSNYRYPSECMDRIPNPHLQYHNCLGNHRRYIQECLREGNLIGAVEQCVSSAKSINIGEGVTVTRFLGALFRSNNRIIELPNGESVNPRAALAWLLEQENTKEEQADV